MTGDAGRLYDVVDDYADAGADASESESESSPAGTLLGSTAPLLRWSTPYLSVLATAVASASETVARNCATRAVYAARITFGGL